MSRRREMLESFLSPALGGRLGSYRGRELDFFRERGRLYPEKLEAFFLAILTGGKTIVGIGPRGGGKTMAAADGALGRFLWCEDDVYHLGGSLKQAREGFRYVRQILSASAELEESLEECLKEAASGPRGNWYRIAASSSKQARGQHPGDPHPEMDWQAHGGLLVLDERDEMDDEIADAAELSMGVATPRTVLITSTAHREDGGGIALLEERAEAMGAEVHKWDILDVSEVCPHDCANCPGGQAFAGALFGGKTVRGKTAATATSVARWGMYKVEANWPADEGAYCLGKAKQHRPGHMRMDAIFEMYRHARNKEIFEVEMLCRKRRGARNVLNPAGLDRALDPTAGYLAGYEAIATIDWGFKGWCVVCVVQSQAVGKIVVVDARYFHLTAVSGIVACLDEFRDMYGVAEVFADASHPYENLEVASAGFSVTECPFARVKEFGAGWLKGLVETGMLVFPGELLKGKDHAGVAQWDYRFSSEGVRELWRQCKKWRRDKHGKIVKEDDHGPDSLLCAAQKFAEGGGIGDYSSEGTGGRIAGGLWGAGGLGG